MPRGDRRGPMGEGPATGRGMGFCVGSNQPGFMTSQSNWGRGYRRRFHGGFGMRPGFGWSHGPANYYQEEFPDVSEKTLIENEIRILKDQLSALEDRLSKADKE